MIIPTNSDLANGELSIEELEAIAAGWPHWVHSVVHAVEKGLEVAAVAAIGVGIVALPLMIGYGALYTARNWNDLQVKQ